MVVLCIDLELPYWVAILLTLVATLDFRAPFNLAVYYPFRNRGFQPVIISSIGASIHLENGVLAATADPTKFLFSSQGVSVGHLFRWSISLLFLSVTVVMVTLQYFFFERTLLGKKMQATSEEKEMASLLGIPVARMIMLTLCTAPLSADLLGF
jgi:branched-chain amino acid transport system permease protein